jgi:hypothetical protein
VKGIIEREIENYANKYNEYPKEIRIGEKEYYILNKEVKKEYLSIGKKIDDITAFRRL